MEFESILELPVYSTPKKEKERLITERMNDLTSKHYNNCNNYKNILDAFDYDINKNHGFNEIPFIPVRLFKELEMKSVSNDKIVKTMMSSGTSGQKVSKIYLDKTTSSNQQKTMIKIVSEYIGNKRIPMIIVDSPSILKDRNSFSARGAGILGFSMFGSDRIYALTNDMDLDILGVKQFLERHKDEKILIFGFTYMIWKHFYEELNKLKKSGTVIDLSSAIMIHGGGWKKLITESVDPSTFNKKMNEVCGITKIHNYYGMVEQTGCIYMECECGHLHASIFSDIIIRNPLDFSECDYGDEGIIQVLSTIPESYPGHSLLTEDVGAVIGEDNCPCGRKGKYFRIVGRLNDAEIRGCSDTYAAKFT